MLRSLTAKQLLEWCQFDEIDPIGDVRLDYLAAQITQMVLAVNLAKSATAPTLSDMLLKWGKGSAPEKKQDWKQMKAITQMIAAAFGEDGKP